MERPRHRRSRSLTGVEGNRDIQKQRFIGNFSSDSSYYNDRTAKHMFESTKSSSKRVVGTPVKKLLVEEMSKEMETKRRSPSVIAKLMGLDGLPSPQHGHRQQTRWSGNHQSNGLPSPQHGHRQQTRRSGNHQSKIASTGAQRDRQIFDGKISRRSSLEHQEFRDVYEDLEASHVVNRRYSSKWSSNSKLKNPEMSIVQQKSVRSLSANEKRHASADYGTHDPADLNNELLLKYLQQSDSIFAKHVNDLQLDPSSPLCNHIAILKPSKSAKYESNAKAWKSERVCVCKQDARSHRKRKDGLLLHSLGHHSAQKTLQPSKIQPDGLGVKQNLPTRIVVLKPGKTSNAMPSVLSPDASHAYLPDCGKHMKCPSIMTAEAISCEERDPSNFVGLSRPKCREAREVAKKITRQMRENFGAFDSGRISFTYSGVRGYAGDESSYDSDSDNGSNIMTITSRKSFGWNSRSRAPSSASSESSMNREAKKRLSERWKVTHGFQDEEMCVKGSTLGEMLAIPEREKKPKQLDARKISDGPSDGFVDIAAGWNGPLGISSRDGWKDGCVKKSSRSRSLPPSLGGKSQKTSKRQEAYADVQCLGTRETMNLCTDNVVNENLSQKECSSSKELRSGGKGPHSCHDKFVVNTNSLPETISSPTRTETNSEKLELSEEQPLASPEVRSSAELLTDLSLSKMITGDSSACDQDYSNLQEASRIISGEGSAPEPESSESSKEADHPSPVSVLEVAFPEDASSGPECFKRVSAELQGLRMQLQLLKMESEGDADVPVFVPSDEDVLPQIEDKHMLRAESWEDSYLFDVLLESGLEEPDPDILTATWQSLECSLGAFIFENLEKKYSDGETGLRSERRLLFDSINSALQEIFGQYMDTCPWVKPAVRSVDSKWQKQGLKDALNKLLGGLEDSIGGDTPERMLDREMEWDGYRDDISMIGKEIEKWLTDELIMEAVAM